MNKVTIDRELLERELLSVLDFSESNLRRVVDHLIDVGYTLAAAPQPPVQDSCVRCGKETVCGKTHCEACCYEPISAPQPSGIEITKLLSCVRYLTGIADRGLKRQIREDESVESFVLGYVQSLETQPSDDVAKDAARYQWLVKHSTYGIDYRQRPELTLSIYAPDHRDGLSAAIDAAMGQGGSDE